MPKDREYNDMPGQEREEIYGRAGKKIKKTVRTAALTAAVGLIIVASFWAGKKESGQLSDSGSVAGGASEGMSIMDAGADTGTGIDTGTDADAGADTGIDADADTGANIGANTDTGRKSDIDSKAEGNASPDRNGLPQPYACYVEVLKQILMEHTDPNGRVDVVYHPMTKEAIRMIEEAYAQASVYAAHADEWMTEEADEPFATMYLLYDMDRDGRLELTANTVRGSGRYSENHFYGLTEDGDFAKLPLVRLCGGKEKESNTDFDLSFREYNTAYQDEEGTIYYEGNDFVREGIYGGYDETGFYCLREGVVYQDSIRTCSRFRDAAGEKEDNQYYRIEDTENAITEQEYEAVRADYIHNMEEIRVEMRWIDFADVELTGGKIPAEQISLRLLTSYLGSR